MNPARFLAQLVLSSIQKTNGDWDEIMIGGFVSLVTLCVLSGIDLIYWHGSFSPMNFGGGAAAIIGAMGGAKTARDRWSSPPAPRPGEGGA